MKKLSRILIVLAVLFTANMLTGCTDLKDEEAKFETFSPDPTSDGTIEEADECDDGNC